jgi:hypothetical protein
MSYATEAVRRYLGRTGAPRDTGLDAAYQYEWTVLRDMLSRLEVILEDEGVPRETAERVIRCVLYGSPSPGAAEERMRCEAEVVKMLNERPAIPFEMSADLAAKLGLPPR